MLYLDLRTLALVAMFSGLMFTATTLSVWRLAPEESGLRQCASGSTLFALGMAEVALRPFLYARLSIPLGNGLTLMGCGFFLIGFRTLLGLPTSRSDKWLPWLYFLLTALGSAYFTLLVPSIRFRITFVSLVGATFHAALARALFRCHDRELASWRQFTIALQIVGFVLYLIRAWDVPDIPEVPDYRQSSSWLVAAPGFYAMCFNVWMAITIVLIANARMHRRMHRQLEEALAFNETLLANSPQAIGVYKADGRCIFVNDAYSSLVGIGKQDLLQQNFLLPAFWEGSGLREQCLAALADNNTQRRDLRLTTPAGQVLWIESRILPSTIKGELHLLVQLFDLTARKNTENTLRELTFHDPLTRLPNRRLFLEQLSRARQNSERHRSHAAILFIDLDKFKHLNDSHGHSVGDERLLETARRLQQTTRPSDTVARFGGDEFVVLLEALGPDADHAQSHALKIVEHMRKVLSAPYALSPGLHEATATIGLRLFYGTDTSAEQILKEADEAMYRLKQERY
ncbi:sensor domain-containing diguanylate cyclase [Paludibacterium yongneupense]|uniref:sensor domain-containing diguanylate cyclase n=1 Tax=Paludibacterium yongneupense TaxID=400061 RepID=UPI00048F9BF5|nr:sensor domain-containing diguanylate cyclase [Paludibacterium yongneupense]